MCDFADLLGDYLSDGRMRVAQADRRDTRYKIQVSGAFVVVEILQMTLRNQQWLSVVMEV